MTAALACDALTLRIGRFTLGPLDLSLESGEYFVLMGPSGCGKTTLLRTLAGVHRLHAGAVRFGDEDLTRAPPHRRRVGYVSQTADLFPHLTVAENIAFGLRYLSRPNRDDKADVARVAELVGVTHLLDRRIRGLSGGESKRVALARALAVRPHVLLLDEPLAMIDPQGRAGMLETLRRIHAEADMTVLHVTHDREEAWRLDTRCAVMRDGRIEQIGRPDAIFRRPASLFVARFGGEENVFAATWRRDGGAWRAIASFGSVPLAAEPPGEAGFVQIRPEAVAFLPDSEQGGDAFASGRVERVRDHGAYREARVRLDDGTLLLVHAARALPCPDAGAGVRLGLAEPAHPLPEDSA